jgi:hypothetical protein
LFHGAVRQEAREGRVVAGTGSAGSWCARPGSRTRRPDAPREPACAGPHCCRRRSARACSRPSRAGGRGSVQWRSRPRDADRWPRTPTTSTRAQDRCRRPAFGPPPRAADPAPIRPGGHPPAVVRLLQHPRGCGHPGADRAHVGPAARFLW